MEIFPEKEFNHEEHEGAKVFSLFSVGKNICIA